MKFDKQITDYLYGRKFSAALDVNFGSQKQAGTSRIEMLLNLSKNKNVIHLGCADHLPLIDQKRKNGNWLHELLTINCHKCIGVDINKEAVQYIREQVGLNNVFLPGQEVDDIIFDSETKWDYIILGELIEHVDNPVQFLKEISEKYASKVKQIIITAPNAFSLLTVKDILNNNENINSDHNYWFSPYTLSKVAIKAGFKNSEFFFADRVKLPLHLAISKRLKQLVGISPKFNANCFNSVVLIAEF
jgi:hypothetical protein